MITGQTSPFSSEINQYNRPTTGEKGILMEEQSIFLKDPEESAADVDPAAIDDDWNSKRDDMPGTDGPDHDRNGADEQETEERNDTNGDNGGMTNSGSDQSFTLKHLGEVTTVGRDEVITLAQKGLDYDRIRRKYDEASAGRAGSPEYEAAVKRQTEIQEFLAEYGTGFDPKSIPQEVWSSVAGGRTLLAAYQAWELKKLRADNNAAKKNTENKERSAGSRFSLGNVKPRDAITDDWYDS